MTEEAAPKILFYHLQDRGPEAALPKLLEKVLAAQFRIAIKCADDDQMATLDSVLWTYDPASFLPHGTSRSRYPEAQPIYLSVGDEVPNAAAVRMILDQAAWPDIGGFERCLYMFDSREEETLATARGHWKRLKDAGHTPTYWQQRPGGGWEQKA